MNRIKIVSLLAAALLLCGCGESQATPSTVAPSEPTDTPEAVQTIEFSGESYSAEYQKCYSVDGIDGCFYVTIKVENNSDAEQVYMLDDVYVDDSHCTTGTGLPVTALGGKKVTGAFIVFTGAPLEEVEKIEFRLVVLDNSTFSEIERSEVITVEPNK